MKRLLVLFVVALALLPAGVARAQEYPPPTPSATPAPTGDIDTCLKVAAEVNGEVRVAQVEFQGEFRLEGEAGCAPANSDVDVFAESERVRLGTIVALEDGSYVGSFRLPASVKPGEHHIILAIEDRGEMSRRIVVVPLSGGKDDTKVLGASETHNGGAGGVLPKTGAGIAMLVMMALALVAGGTVLVNTTRTRLVGAWAGRHGAQDDIQFVDTSRFVPARSRQDRPDPLAAPPPKAGPNVAKATKTTMGTNKRGARPVRKIARPTDDG